MHIRHILFFICIDIYGVKNPQCINDFGLHLRQLRGLHNLSQQQLADIADLDKKTIYRIENGILNPTLDTLYCIATALQMELKQLMDFELTKSSKKDIKKK